MKRRVRTVSSAWFRSRVLPVLHDSWAEAEADLLAEPDEARRVDELAAELVERGFDYPVCVDRDRWWHRRPRVLDGMHRSIAAMRQGLDIPIEYGEPHKDGYDHYDEYTVTLVDPQGDLVETFDRVLSAASFRSSDGFWIRWEAAHSTGPEMALELPRREERRIVIADELERRLQAAGIPATVRFAGQVDIDEDLLPR